MYICRNEIIMIPKTIEELEKKMRQKLSTASKHEKDLIALFIKQAHMMGKQEQLDEVKTYQELIK